MAVHSFEDLLAHVDHYVVVTTYGEMPEGPTNVSIECDHCAEVLLDFSKGDPSAGSWIRNAVAEQYRKRYGSADKEEN